MARGKEKQKIIDTHIENQVDPMDIKKKEAFKEKDPAFLLYPSDFLAMTSDLTDEETGQLIKFFCYQFQNGHLSDKIIKLRFNNPLSKCVKEKLQTDTASNLYSAYLDRRIYQRMNFVKSRQENGKKHKGKFDEAND